MSHRTVKFLKKLRSIRRWFAKNWRWLVWLLIAVPAIGVYLVLIIISHLSEKAVDALSGAVNRLRDWWLF